MDKCFVPCGCEGREGTSKSELDRFTDNIENVLNDEKGKKLFRDYISRPQQYNRKGSLRKLDVLELIDKIINKKVEKEDNAINSLLKKAEHIEELDSALMKQLHRARNSDNKEDIIVAFKLLKTETIKSLRREYDAFRNQHTPKK